MNFAALVLAGNRTASTCEVAALGDVSHKALLPIAGKPMVERVIETIASVPSIGKIGVVIEEPELLRPVAALSKHLRSGFLQLIEARPTPAQSALHGVRLLAAETGMPTVLTTADNCLITPEMLTYFLDHLPNGTDLSAALADTDKVCRAFPDARRTRLKFRDGPRSGCNLFACQTPDAQRVIEFWRKIEQDRKNPMAMLRQLGVLTAARYASGQLTLADALRQLERKTKTKLGVVEMVDPVAAVDVDTPEDFYLAERILSARETD